MSALLQAQIKKPSGFPATVPGAVPSSLLRKMDGVEQTLKVCQTLISRSPDSVLASIELCSKKLSEIQGELVDPTLRVGTALKRLNLLRTHCQTLREQCRLSESTRENASSSLSQKTGCFLKAVSADQDGVIEELSKLLEKLGLLEHLHVKMSEKDESTNPAMKILHLGREIEPLVRKHNELIPYFFNRTGNSCFVQGQCYTGASISEKGLFEDFTVKKALLTALLEEADREFRSFASPPPPIDFTPSEEALSSDVQLLEDVFKTQDFEGLCLGENHQQQLSKKFILDNLTNFKNQGVTTLFMEHFMHDTMQPYLDAYFASPSAPMSPILEAYIEDVDRRMISRAPYTLMSIVRSAKEAGIRIVGIDSSIAAGAGFDPISGTSGPVRWKAMNYTAQQVIQKEKGSGKYVALFGNSHGSNMHTNSEVVPGLANLLKVPFFCLEDSSNATSSARVNVSPNRQIRHAHLHLKRPKVTSN